MHSRLTEERVVPKKITTEEPRLFDGAHEFDEPAIETELPFDDRGPT